MADERKKEVEARESNLVDGLAFKTPDIDEIRCKDCEFAAEDSGKLKGPCRGKCAVYPNNDKPISILWSKADCEYFVDKNTK